MTNVREVDAPPQPQPIPDVPAPEIGYEHLRTIVRAVLGLHGTVGQLDTIMTAVQAYAAGQAAECVMALGHGPKGEPRL